MSDSKPGLSNMAHPLTEQNPRQVGQGQARPHGQGYLGHVVATFSECSVQI